MAYEIVAFRREFMRPAAEVQTFMLGPDVVANLAYLEWKYHRNPYVSEPLIYLALHEGIVVGMRGMFGAKWQLGQPSQTFLAPCAGDLVIAPDHRNRGLVAKIMEKAVDDLADRGYQYAFSLGASLATQMGSLMTGWRSVGPLETAYRGTARRKDQLADAGQAFSLLDENSGSAYRTAKGHLVVEKRPRPDVMSELIERIGTDGRIQHVRDREYFAWRFENPRSMYRFLFWFGSRLEGYLILQKWLYRKRPTPVRIVDWEASSAAVRADLLEAAIRWGKFDELSIWWGGFPAGTKVLLQDAGFKAREVARTVGHAYRAKVERRVLLLRSVGEGANEACGAISESQLSDIKSWDLRMIYSDAS
jgi:GNAT superfamily N-acetyltransferase